MVYQKALFIDLDGTLLNNKHAISTANKSAVEQALSCGILPILTTGRPPQAVFTIAESLALDHLPIICLNGALIYQAREVLLERSIPTATVLDLVKHIPTDFSLSFLAHTNWYVPQIDDAVKREMGISGMEPEVIPTKNFLDRLQVSSAAVHKVLAIGSPTPTAALGAQLRQSYFSKLNIVRSTPFYLAITHGLSSKGQAMKWILDRYQLSVAEAIAIGDGYNDVDMIVSAGQGIAMGNAPKEVQDKADFVSLTNEENGFSHALQTLQII